MCLRNVDEGEPLFPVAMTVVNHTEDFLWLTTHQGPQHFTFHPLCPAKKVGQEGSTVKGEVQIELRLLNSQTFVLLRGCPVLSASSSLEQVEPRGFLSHWERHQLLLILIVNILSSPTSFPVHIWDSCTCVFMCRSQVTFYHEPCGRPCAVFHKYMWSGKGGFSLGSELGGCPGTQCLLSPGVPVLGECSSPWILVGPCPRSGRHAPPACNTGFWVRIS